MKTMELLRMLRNNKWKFIIIIPILSALYYLTYYNTEATSIGAFSPWTHQQLLTSIAVVPVFLLNILLFTIGEEEENIHTWHTLLSFPIRQYTRIAEKFGYICLFQFIFFLIGTLYFIFLGGSDISLFISFLLSIQLIHTIAFFYYTFYVSSGLFNGKPTNAVRSLTPLFLVASILNAGDWTTIYSIVMPALGVIAAAMMLVLFWKANQMMYYKLNRELILKKLFGDSMSMNPTLTYIKSESRKKLDQNIQKSFKKHKNTSPTYWRTIAALEVILKGSFKLLFFALLFFSIYVDERQSILLFFSAAILLYVIYSYFKVRKRINRVMLPKDFKKVYKK